MASFLCNRTLCIMCPHVRSGSCTRTAEAGRTGLNSSFLECKFCIYCYYLSIPCYAYNTIQQQVDSQAFLYSIKYTVPDTSPNPASSARTMSKMSTSNPPNPLSSPPHSHLPPLVSPSSPLKFILPSQILPPIFIRSQNDTIAVPDYSADSATRTAHCLKMSDSTPGRAATSRRTT